MISRSSQSIGRFSQLRFSHVSIRRNELLLSHPEGTTVLLSTLLARINIGHNGFSPISRRTYTDRPVSRPKAHTGRTTTTRKKKAATTVKVAEKPSSEVSEQPVEKKPKAKTKPKPKSKLSTSKASTAKRSKAKAKSKPKPKSKSKSKSKPKPKPRVKKVLTEKQKDLLAKKKAKEIIKALKIRALTPPKIRPSNAWIVFTSEKLKGSPGFIGNGLVKQVAETFRDLTPERLEHYNHIANQNKLANKAEYKKWVQTYTPQEIHSANLARLALKRRRVRGYHKIADDRQVRGRHPPFLYFVKERHASGDFKGIALKDCSKLIGTEWNELSSDMKKKYSDLATQDRERYAQEVESLHSSDATPTPVPQAAASAASAA